MPLVGLMKDEYLRNRCWWNGVNLFSVMYMAVVWICLNSPYQVDYFNEECVRAHNLLRARHSTSPLSASVRLMRYSKGRAEYLVQQGVLAHLQNNHGYGENLMMIQGDISNFTCEFVIQKFYDEFKDFNFDFNNPSWSEKTGHATQVIWKSTTEVGCYEKMSRHSRQKMTVCTYYPPGNVLNHFKQNVLPPIS